MLENVFNNCLFFLDMKNDIWSNINATENKVIGPEFNTDYCDLPGLFYCTSLPTCRSGTLHRHPHMPEENQFKRWGSFQKDGVPAVQLHTLIQKMVSKLELKKNKEIIYICKQFIPHTIKLRGRAIVCGSAH